MNVRSLLLAGAYMSMVVVAASAEPTIALEPVIDSADNMLDDKAWSLGEGYDPDRLASFTWHRDNERFNSAPDSLYLKSTSVQHSGYWSQVVNVEADKTYFMFLRFRHRNARILIWLSGSAGKLNFDERIYALMGKPNFLVPVFLKPSYTTGGDVDPDRWHILARSITIPDEMSTMRVGLGSYFGTGEIWFDDAYLGQGVPKLRLTAAHLQPGDRVTVEMTSTRDVIFSRDIETQGEAIDTVIEDAQADESYIARIRREDETIVSQQYPFEHQVLTRN